MDWTQIWTFLDKGADILGIISFLIAIPTYINTQKAKTAIMEYVVEIDDIIIKLNKIYNSIDASNCSESELQNIYNTLIRLQVFYKPIVKKFRFKIWKTKKLIKTMLFSLYGNNEDNKKKLLILLAEIISRLQKMKKVKRNELSASDLANISNSHTKSL